MHSHSEFRPSKITQLTHPKIEVVLLPSLSNRIFCPIAVGKRIYSRFCGKTMTPDFFEPFLELRISMSNALKTIFQP